jgi:hypothetical protein
MGKGEIDFDLAANARDAQDLAHRTTRNRDLSKSNFLQGKTAFRISAHRRVRMASRQTLKPKLGFDYE